MNRRNFLKKTMAAVLGGLAAIVLPAGEPAAQAKSNTGQVLLRGSLDGKVLESLDGGSTWRSIADFGPSCPVLRAYEDKGMIFAELRSRGVNVTLKTCDRRQWYTLDWSPPSGERVGRL